MSIARDPFAVPLPAPAAAGPSAARYLRGEHCRLQQMLSLLTQGAEHDPRTIRKVLANVSAHLAGEGAFLYPLLDRTRQPALARRCAVRPVSNLRYARAPAVHRRSLLIALEDDFREHARLVDSVAMPWLEDTMARATLETLRHDLVGTRGATEGAGRARRSG